MICPDFEVVTQACVVFSEVIQEDNLFATVSIPPLVKRFDEQPWVLLAGSETFAGPCGTVEPLVGKGRQGLVGCGVELVQLNRLLDLGVVSNIETTIGDHSLWVLYAGLVELGPGLSLLLLGLWHLSEMPWALDSGLFLGAVAPRMESGLGSLDVGSGPHLLNCSEVLGVSKANEALEVRRARLTSLELADCSSRSGPTGLI